ncbi:HipA family kinase [Prosthecobacter sp.]|uniref:HipA family kinase n=1 Tax=Prosthecobacter sp. TaxID=1965333 RepID=UPI003784078A
MNPNNTITAVLGRSEQGMTRPFLCQLNRWNTCYVKGAYAGKRSLCCEWVAGWLAKAVLDDLPGGVPSIGVPVIEMAQVPRALIETSARKDIGELGAGTVFASCRVDGAQELSWSSAQDWPAETMAALLLTDLWLHNEDRSLSAKGGNPNLLVAQIPPLPDWDEESALWKDIARREMLWAYDFNLAFDDHFDRSRFFDAHVFGNMLTRWPDGFRETMEPRLREGVERLPELFAQLPPEWLHLDGDESLPVQLDMARVLSVLNLPFTAPEHFWKLP